MKITKEEIMLAIKNTGKLYEDSPMAEDYPNSRLASYGLKLIRQINRDSLRTKRSK